MKIKENNVKEKETKCDQVREIIFQYKGILLCVFDTVQLILSMLRPRTV